MATLDAPLSHVELTARLAGDERMALSFRDGTLADERAVAKPRIRYSNRGIV